MEHQGEFQLSSPEDAISSVKFAPSTNFVLAACWDAKLRLYDASQKQLVHVFEAKGPLLDGCFLDNTHGVAGGLDQAVRVFDLNVGGAGTVLGSHGKAIRCLEYSPRNELLFSGGWDAKVNAWDPRAASGQRALATLDLPGKAFTMALTETRIVVGTADRRIVCYDIRNLSQPEFSRESSLKYQTRCIRAFPDGEGFALSSIEGRVAIEYFSPEAEAKKYAFKCHRVMNMVFPVNAIAFHPIHGTFATGGCDGYVNVWDGRNKKRLCQLPSYPTSIASLSFNRDGTMLAVASSYTFEEGEKDHPPDQLFIRHISDADVKPKPRT
uniref:Anaphase-promoting complex subunit 4 WD40 domain-containing protein n=1 Tax=Octactis speculum TaxID=3111310 RepID=A0A7S2HTA8_9STRA|mmetsp:Transcript_9224/g.11882  ORF Transcript_9224/g.11882 Transcript_9224/m.11882 type:complete len:324 (+) Transcript_9224:79-1050(+)